MVDAPQKGSGHSAGPAPIASAGGTTWPIIRGPAGGRLNQGNQMNRLTGLTLALAAAAVSSGCTFQHQAVRIEPQVDVLQSDLGKGRKVLVRVVDERPKTTLGTRGARGVGADMTIEGDVTQIFRMAIEDGLSKQGFSATQDASEQRQLRVELRNLDYDVIVGFWAGTLKVDTTLKGVCQQGAARQYEAMHRGEFVESVQVVQGAEANNSYVSDSASNAINALLRDRELMSCLAS